MRILRCSLLDGKWKQFCAQGTYSLARAQQSFKSLVHIHEKNGCYHNNNMILLMIVLRHNFLFQVGSPPHKVTDRSKRLTKISYIAQMSLHGIKIFHVQAHFNCEMSSTWEVFIVTQIIGVPPYRYDQKEKPATLLPKEPQFSDLIRIIDHKWEEAVVLPNLDNGGQTCSWR